MNKSLFIIVHLLIGGLLHGQQIKHISTSIQNQRMEISYNLVAEAPFRVYVYQVSGEDSLEKVAKEDLQGDVGLYVKPGVDKHIFWNLQKIDSTERTNIQIKMKTSPFIKKIEIKGGSFLMGCTSEQPKCDGDEKPAHRITLSGFSMSAFEITNEQYCVFLNEKDIAPDGRDGRVPLIHVGNKYCQVIYKNGEFISKPGKAKHPVVEVTWSGAQAFCEWAGGRLPTEAEWEYAARGGHKSTSTIYSGSNDVDSVAWYVKNSGDHSHKVGTKQPNELGLYDMSGNVWEWCYDWYGDYPKRKKKNPEGPRRGNSVVIRGGSWLYYGSFCRVSNRGSSGPSYAFNNYGFRLVIPSEK
jgi:formylglycine-generating enzyme required for sulfatase activity